jgi:hypothetical protein
VIAVHREDTVTPGTAGAQAPVAPRSTLGPGTARRAPALKAPNGVDRMPPMVLSIAAALIAATALVVAARGVRERRALAADVRALRADLRRLARAFESRAATARGDGGSVEAAAGPTGADPATADEQAVQARGSRTLH